MQKRRRISTFYFQIVQRLCWSIVAVPLGALLIEFKSRLNVFWKLLPQIRNAADDVLFLIIIFIIIILIGMVTAYKDTLNTPGKKYLQWLNYNNLNLHQLQYSALLNNTNNRCVHFSQYGTYLICCILAENDTYN